LVSVSKGQRAAIQPIQGRGMGVLKFLHCDVSLDETFINGIELKFTNAPRPAGYWDLDKCKASAAQYTSVGDWQAFEGGAYRAAQENGWMDECCPHMRRKSVPSGHWLNIENCKVDAAKYTTRKAWKVGNGAAYQVASQNGWLDECCAHMEQIVSDVWTLEKMMAIGSQYQSREEWKEKDPKSFKAAIKRGWVRQSCQHMPYPHSSRSQSDENRKVA
jgi:hypothetical protein